MLHTQTRAAHARGRRRRVSFRRCRRSTRDCSCRAFTPRRTRGFPFDAATAGQYFYLGARGRFITRFASCSRKKKRAGGPGADARVPPRRRGRSGPRGRRDPWRSIVSIAGCAPISTTCARRAFALTGPPVLYVHSLRRPSPNRSTSWAGLAATHGAALVEDCALAPPVARRDRAAARLDGKKRRSSASTRRCRCRTADLLVGLAGACGRVFRPPLRVDAPSHRRARARRLGAPERARPPASVSGHGRRRGARSIVSSTMCRPEPCILRPAELGLGMSRLTETTPPALSTARMVAIRAPPQFPPPRRRASPAHVEVIGRAARGGGGLPAVRAHPRGVTSGALQLALRAPKHRRGRFLGHGRCRGDGNGVPGRSRAPVAKCWSFPATNRSTTTTSTSWHKP